MYVISKSGYKSTLRRWNNVKPTLIQFIVSADIIDFES